MSVYDRSSQNLSDDKSWKDESVTRLEELLRSARMLLDKAENSVRDQRLLLRVGVELGASLDYETTLQKVARLVVADFADWCFVDLVDSTGRIRDVAVAHRHRDKEELARGLLRNLPQLASAPHGVVRVLRTRETEMYTSAADQPPPLGHYLGVDYPDALRELGARSYICVPLLVREKALGAITYVRGPDSQGYDRRDLELAGELARRSATAIDNALLFQKTSDAVRKRDEVMAILSHDLRSFVGAVTATTGMLLKKEQPADVRESLERLDRTAEKTKDVIENVLEVSRIESGAVPLSLCARDAETLVSDALDAAWTKARAKGITLESHIAPGLRVQCDPTRIFQVLTNLLDNALKFTPFAGNVAIRAWSEETKAVFTVSDSGTGISEEDLPHLFDRFWQGHNQAHVGAGLGLAIVKGIVEAHGGRVFVESRPNEVTTFGFTLPLANEERERRVARSSEPLGRRNDHQRREEKSTALRILLADDDDIFRSAVRAALGVHGYEVIEVCDGAAALEALAKAADGREAVPDAVVLDIRMPGCSGLGVLSAMSHFRRRPPTLLVTGFKDPSVHVVAERLGASRVIFKPADVDDVVAVVRELVERASNHVS